MNPDMAQDGDTLHLGLDHLKTATVVKVSQTRLSQFV